MPWDEVQMKMPSTFSKRNRINTLATAHLLDQLRGTLNNRPPLQGFIRAEIHRASDVTPGIEKTPSRQRRGQIMVAQEPKTIAPDFSGSEPIPVGMKAADAAGGGDGGHDRVG